MPRESKSRPIRILLAEDNETDFLFLHHMLRKAPGASLYRVSDGEQAVNYLRGTGIFSDRSAYPLPDILLVDLKLPKISGHEILEWLRHRPEFRNLKKCVLSSSDRYEDKMKAGDSGADDYFVKPLSLGHLAALFGRPGGPGTKPVISSAGYRSL